MKVNVFEGRRVGLGAQNRSQEAPKEDKKRHRKRKNEKRREEEQQERQKEVTARIERAKFGAPGSLGRRMGRGKAIKRSDKIVFSGSTTPWVESQENLYS